MTTTTEPTRNAANPSTTHAATGHGAEPTRNTGGEELREDADSRIYEVGYLVVPTVTEEELPREVTTLKDVLERERVRIISEEFPKFRTLAYPMQKRLGGTVHKYANAYFGWVKFEARAESVKAIGEAFKASDKVLRFILTKTVREATMVGARPMRAARPERKEAPKGAPAPAPVSEAELDKSIEKLIAE